MVTLDAYASAPQYLDHLAPMWEALPAALRGTLWTPGGFRVPEGLSGRRWSTERPRGPNPVLVAAYSDYKACHPAPVVFIEHGTGQTYAGGDGAEAFNPCYSGGLDRERTLLFLCPNERVRAANQRTYPQIPAVVVGSPRLDRWHARQAARVSSPEAATVAVSFHWDWWQGPPEGRSAFLHYWDSLAPLADEFRLLGHGHPRAWPFLREVWESLGVEAVEDFADVLDRADVFVADNSSALYEFASLDKPVVVLNAPWYRREVEHGLRFWEHAGVGVQVDEPSQLSDAIRSALEDPPDVRMLRRRAVAATYPLRDGKATARAIEAIRAALATWSPQERIAMPNPYEAKSVYVPPPEEAQPDALLGVSYAEVPTDLADGTIAEVLSRVGGDPGQASAAIEAEQAKPRPRTRLLAALQEIVNGGH